MLFLSGVIAAAMTMQSTPPAALERDPTPPEVDEAWTAFDGAPKELRDAIVAEITKRVDASPEPQLKKLLDWRDRARKELKVEPAPAPSFFDPNVYARGLVHRVAATPESADAAEKRELYRPWENQPLYYGSVRYDFGRNCAIDYGGTLEAGEQLHNYLFGYPPGVDRLVAWITARFDFDASVDPLALHFEHLYCDLNGKAYPEITLYDAWGSGNSIDMPDVDVIAFARNILKDDSWVSPIAPNAAQPLYEKARQGFLNLFRYRLWIEASANVFVNPEAPIRGTHEGLRGRLHYLFALDAGELEPAVTRLTAQGSRGEFLSRMDDERVADTQGGRKIAFFLDARARARWAIARASYAVLREKGLLVRPKSEPAAKPDGG